MPESKLSGVIFFKPPPSLSGLAGPLMTEAPPPGSNSRRSCGLMKALLMFGDGVASPLKSFAADFSSHDSSPEPERSTTTNFFFLRELWGG